MPVQMTFALTIRGRLALTAATVALLAGGYVAWIVVQDRQYGREWDRAIAQHVMQESPPVASVSAMHAISTTTLPRPVKDARIDLVNHEELVRVIENHVAASESVDAPRRWTSRHQRAVALAKATRELFVARAEQQRYVVEYLGEAPTLRGMADLADDTEYVGHLEPVRVLVDRAKAAERRLHDAEPRFSSVLYGPVIHGRHLVAQSHSDDVIGHVASCAQARLDSTTSTAARSLQACDPRPTRSAP